MVEDNKRLVRRWTDEVWNQGKLDLIDELVAPDYVRQDPAWPEEVQGREGLRQYVSTVRQAFTDLQVTIEDIIAEADKVVVRWRAKATHQGDFLGIRPTWREIAMAGISIHRIASGRIAETWDRYDALGLMQQLGVVP